MNESYTPGDEYDLVDRFAKELKLDRWYQWTDDWKALSGTQAEPAARKSADQDDLLREREPAAEFYCLAALQKFDGMERREIVSIVSEIAMLGQSGLNYTSSEQKYSLRNMPGEYSGLQLLCYMYVGFQLIDPSVDIGVDLSRPYASAKSLHDLGGTKL